MPGAELDIGRSGRSIATGGAVAAAGEAATATAGSAVGPHLYDYAVIRVVPRVEREEFVNAGVIVSCQASAYLAAAIALDEDRVRALDAGVDIDLVREHLAAIPRICSGGPGAGPIGALPLRARFHWLTARRSALVQTSPVHTGRTARLEDVAEHLLDCLVRPPRTRAADGDAPGQPCGPPRTGDDR